MSEAETKSAELPLGSGGETTWRAPMALWRFYLLSVATGGIYVLIWYIRALRDIKENSNEKVGLFLYIAGYCIPIINALPYFFFARMVHRIARAGGEKARFSPFLLAVLFLAILLINVPYARWFKLEPLYILPHIQVILALPSIMFWCALYLPILNALNKFKTETGRKEFFGPVNRYSWGQRISLFICLPIWALLALGLVLLSQGFDAGTSVTGKSGIYQLTIPAKGWNKGRLPGYKETGGDLELANHSKEAWVVVHVHASGENLDNVVAERRRFISTTMSVLSIDERRDFRDATKLQTSSRSVFRVKNPGFETIGIFRVSVLVIDEGIIEIIGYGPDGAIQNDLEAMITGINLSPTAQAPEVADK